MSIICHSVFLWRSEREKNCVLLCILGLLMPSFLMLDSTDVTTNMRRDVMQQKSMLWLKVGHIVMTWSVSQTSGSPRCTLTFWMKVPAPRREAVLPTRFVKLCSRSIFKKFPFNLLIIFLMNFRFFWLTNSRNTNLYLKRRQSNRPLWFQLGDRWAMSLIFTSSLRV